MKKSISFCVISVCCALLTGIAARADSLARVASPGISTGPGKVLKDKSNIRARAALNAEVVAQVNSGDSVEVLERKTADGREWLRIVLPATAECYVNSKFVQDSAISGNNVNVRCGPGTSYKDVGKLSKGEAVTVLGTKGEWTQIKPTSHCTGWIAADLVEATEQPVVPPMSRMPDIVTPPVSLPHAVSSPIKPTEPAEVRTQIVVKDGILAAAKGEPNAPASYELRTEEIGGRDYRIAFLETTESNLARYEGKHVRVIGTERWAKGERYPVIAVERMEMVW
jgi:uncharacterized protein YgiM (DUF1202 family)